jgi:hypothetical protein
MWRVILQLGFDDRSWMVVPIRVPLLLRYLPEEDAIHRMHHQAAQADDVLFVDACTEHGNGIGFLPDSRDGTPSTPLSSSNMLAMDGKIADADINLLELSDGCHLRYVQWLLCAWGQALRSRTHTDTFTFGLTTRRACRVMTEQSSPSSPFVFRRRWSPSSRSCYVTVTMGHVPGVVNIDADAASRQFQLTNWQASAIRVEMEKLPRIPWPAGLLSQYKSHCDEQVLGRPRAKVQRLYARHWMASLFRE